MSTGNIGKIKASRVNNVPNVESYLGEKGILFYNYANGVIRMSDGITPGGVPIPYNIASNVTIGGIKAGPGVVISNDGELYIDSANLALSFGNFTANTNVLSIVNVDEDMVLETSGNAEIQLVGNVGFYRTNGGGAPDPSAKFFTADGNGQITILVPTEDPITGGVEIIGSASGNYVAPGTSGTMLHLTGNPNVSCRLYQDSIGSYSSFVGRRYNGNVTSPTQVLAGQDVLRFNATAATDAGVGNVALAQIAMTALEDQTTTAQGSEITFTVTPIGSAATSRVEVANITVANGVTATKFTTTGNVIANVIVAASAGNINLAGNLVPTANTYTLGTEADPWQSAYFGPQSITIADSTGNVANAVVIENAAGNITMAAAGFEILTLDTGAPIFRIAALTGQIFSNARTIIENTTQSASVSSGSLQTAGGAGIAKDLYVGGNITANVNVTVTGNVSAGNVSVTGKVTGNLTGTASTATSLAAATSILAGSLTINPTNIGKNSASIQTFTLTGLTTSHKIVIMPGTALTFGMTISAAWASALNTLSIEFQNGTGGGVDLGNTDIQYFAWV